ncbi:hypothetical protein FPQ18DRAFT_376158 [Pyronema domesticum]|uniref:Uncharacterized protein n=1 Tax=Pyronema omphalodes (strain CBS 100304) TaxID=1076935 RepID=U4L6M4_PYROM|nr:hypothetical protein FPQ18DRAFT_376158 [Pyronema domesticum]CCX13069.1 Similar to hypothetical protein [Tuber melanosporum Mel28]; acc. no. XP_002840581 [Pyronema omphalodes CBS 100304]
MNWTGGARARASKASTGVVAKQKQYFARVRAKATADAFMGAPSSVGDIDPDQGHDYEHEALDLSPVRQRKVVVPEFDIIVGKQDNKGSPAADEGEEEGFLRTRKRLASRASETILLGQGPTKKVKKDTLEKRKKKLPETEDWLFTGLSLPAPRIKKMDPPPPPPPPPPRASQTAMPPPEQYTLRNTTRWNSQPQSQATLMHPAAPRPSQTVTEAGTEVMMHVDTGFNTFKGLSQGGYIRIGKGRQGPPSSSSLDWERVTNAGNSPSTRGFNIKEYRALQAAQASQASQAPRVERASQASKDSRASQDFRALLGMDPRSREKRPVELFPPRALPIQHSQPSMPAAPETPSRDDEEQEEVGKRLDDEDGDEDEDLPASFTHRYHEYSDPFGPGNLYQSNNPLDPRNRPRPPPPPSPMPALNLPRHVTEDAVSSPMRSTPPIFPSPPKPKSTAASTIEGLLRDVSEIAASSVVEPSQRLVPEPLRINTPSSPTSYVTHFVSRGIESDEMEFTNIELPDIEEEDEEVELPPLRNDTPRMVFLTAETDLPSAMSSNSELQQVEDTTEELEDLEMDLEKLFGKGSKKEFEKVLNMDEEWRRFLQPAAPEDSDAVEAQEDRISSDVMAVSEYQSEETNAATSGIEDSGFPDEKQMAVINDAIEQFIREYGSTQPPAIDQPMEQDLPVQTQAISNTLEEIIGLPTNTGGQSEDPELLISSQTAPLDPVLVANEKSVPTYKEQEPPTPTVPLSSPLSSPKLPATPPPVLPDQAPIIPDDPNQAWHDFICGPSSSLDNSDNDLFSLPLPSVPKPTSRTFSSHFTALAAIEAPSSPNHRHRTLGHRFTAPTATEAPSSPNLSRQVRRGFTAINTPSSPPAYPRNAGRKFTTTEAPTSPDRNRNIGRRFTALTATEMPSSLPAHGARSRYFGGSDTPSGPSSRATRGSSPTMNETGHSFITPLREEREGRERRSITPQLLARVGGGKSFSTMGNVSAPTTPGTPGVASDLSSVSDPVEGSGRR